MTKIKQLVNKVAQIPFIDMVLGKAISKKLTVFLIGTIFLYLGRLDSEQWVSLAMVYIGSQAVIDTMIQLRKNGQTDEVN